jgi:hypothetical protein
MRKIAELHSRLQKTASVQEKIGILDAEPAVVAMMSGPSPLRILISGLMPESELAMKELLAIGQLERIIGKAPLAAEPLRELIDTLLSVDSFYRELGGIVGYHEKLLSLLQAPSKEPIACSYHSPAFQDISHPTASVMEMIGWGIDALPELAEIYPLGGAADRLHLVDEKTGSELPAAKLEFAGRSLFAGLILDLAARESLYFKIYGKQIVTPIAIMTSLEKDNHRHVLEIAEEHRWFGRPKETIRLFTQPLVPVVNQTGEWCLTSPCKLLLKPGGHGAIWKLARDVGIFTWLDALKRSKALIRQINNPIAGLDYGLLAFMGIGWKKNMKFGFASCPRLLEAAEGVNVLIERSEGGRSTIVLTNVEYCDFKKFGIEDRPLREGEPFSRFSSNTNILFADLDAVKEAVDQCPFPGLLINMKTGISVDERGEKREEPMARLESTMQNIADVFIEEKGDSSATRGTFVTYNHRHKTISTAKKAYAEGRSLQETPENCFYELLMAARELLEKECGYRLPSPRTLAEYLRDGPELVFLYHPALGPLYSIIRQKIQQGRIAVGSEMQLQISEVFLSGLDLDGSLRISAEQVMGHLDEKWHLRYSEQVGRCSLINVVVRNRGVAWGQSTPFWKGRFVRLEGLEIVLKGRSEFVAKGVSFEGAHRFEVEESTRLIVEQHEGKLVLKKEQLEAGPFWTYRWGHGGVLLNRGAARDLAAH